MERKALKGGFGTHLCLWVCSRVCLHVCSLSLCLRVWGAGVCSSQGIHGSV